MRDRRYIADGDDGEARGLQRPKRRFTARARPANLDFEILHAVLHGLLAGVLGSDLRRIGRGFARSLETHGPRRRPGDSVSLRIGDGDHGVVETCMHMSDARGDVFLFPAANACLVCGHAYSRIFTNWLRPKITLQPSSIETLTSSCLRSAWLDLCACAHWCGSSGHAPASRVGASSRDNSQDPSIA